MSRPDAPRLLDATIRLDHLPADRPRPRRRRSTRTSARRSPQSLERHAIERLEVELTAVPLPRRHPRRRAGCRRASCSPGRDASSRCTQDIDEPIDRIFLPGGEKPPADGRRRSLRRSRRRRRARPFRWPRGRSQRPVIETLALAIDPYPRAPGESARRRSASSDRATDSRPFAALKARSKKTDDDG